jgi:arylsulfatase A-like enzyme
VITGKYGHLTGFMKNEGQAPFDGSQQTFPKLLQAAGYNTAMIGKWHLGSEPTGFSHWEILPGQGHYYNPDFLIEGERKRFAGYVTDIITETTLDWLKNKRDPEKPFCVLYHQKAPHRNWKPAPEYLTLFDDTTFMPPENFFDTYEGRGNAAKEQEMQIDGHMMWGHDFKMRTSPEGEDTGFNNELNRFNEEQLEQWLAAYTPKNDAMKAANLTGKDLAIWKYNRYIKDYLRTIKSVDDGVGEVLDYLDESGLAENTIVIYTSDQGFYLGEHGWFDKRFMYEESFRTPILMRYPKEIDPGTVVNELIQNLDFAPTFLDYAGVEIPAEMQGESFRKIVSGEKSEWRDAIYYTYYEYPSVHMVKRHYGVRTDRYKLMHFYYDIDEWEMYDLEKDPREMKNIYDDPDYSEVKELMHSRLVEMRDKYGDSKENDDAFLEAYLESMKKRNR